MSSTAVIPLNRRVLIEKTIHIIECWKCSIDFGIGDHFMAERRKDHTVFYCPNGHGNYYNQDNEKERLKKSEAALKARELALRDQLTAAIREGEETKSALLRDRARFAAGVCPCCNRSFENVRRHMTAKHPAYDVTRVAKTPAKFKCSCYRSFDTYQGLRIHQGKSRDTEGAYAWDNPDTSRYYAHLTVVNAK